MNYPQGTTPLDPDKMEGLRYRHITTRGELDELEQANIDEGLQWLKRQKNPDVLTEGFVCEVHEKLRARIPYNRKLHQSQQPH